MPEDANQKTAFDLLNTQDADVLSGPEGVLVLDFPCPDNAEHTEGLHCEAYGVRARCWCPLCRNEGSDEEFPIYGIHDILGRYVVTDSNNDLTLKDVPASRVKTVTDNTGTRHL